MEAIEKVVRLLSHSFTFGYHGKEDIEQQARLYAIQAVDSGRYDPSRPLENFLYAHCKNRLINFRRDKYRRNDPPCLICHRAVGTRTEHPDGIFCEKYVTWKERNDSKASIMRPMDIDKIPDEAEANTRFESSVEEEVEIKELIRRVDAELPVELRSTYLQMRTGQSVSKVKRVQVERVVREILSSVLEQSEE